MSKKSKRTSVKYLESLLEKVGLNYSDFNLDSYIKVVEKRNKDVIEAQKEIDWTILTEEEKIEEYKKLMIYDLNEAWNYTLKNEKTIFDSLSFIDIVLMKKYNYLTKVKDEEMVVYYKCEFIDEINENEYFLLLNELKKNNDVYLLEKTVTENNRIYPIDYEDVSILSKILLKIYLSKKSKST